MKNNNKSEHELLQEINILTEENLSLKAKFAQDSAVNKQANIDLIASESRYRTLFEAAKDGILVLDAETGMILDVNPFLINLLGFSKQQFIEKAIWEIGFFKDLVANQEKFLELQQKEYVRYEDLPLQTASGRQINVEFVSNVYFVNKHKVIQCNIRDITGLKRVVIELREKEVQYRNLADSGLALIWTSGTDKLYNYFNQPWLNFTGRTLEQELGDGWTEGIHPEDLDRYLNTYLTAFDKRDKFDMEFRLRHVSGEYRWMQKIGTPSYNSKGEFIGYIGHCFDITRRKKAEQSLIIANKELAFQNEEKENRESELIIANRELAFQNEEKENRASELIIANKELLFQNEEKEKRASELIIANEELLFQNEEKEKRASELIVANKELAFQNEEKEKRAEELIIANKELAFQNEEKEKRAEELIIANKELVFQNEEKEKRAAELKVADKELMFQTEEKEKRAAELIIADKELVYQTEEKEKRAAELIIADKELVYQTEEKEKRAAELVIADKELVFQTEEKEKRAAELVIADKELVYQTEEKEKRAVELRIANKELKYQNELKERTKQLIEANNELVEAKSEAEKANRAKSTFLANMSHEIRTPMNAVLGFSELLNNLVTDPKAKNYLKSIQSSGKTLLSLINDILDLSKIEAGMLVINTHVIDIKQLVNEIKQIFSYKIEEKGLDFIMDFADNIPLQLYLDELRIRQVILNLVGNAVKFTEKGFIKVSINYLNNEEHKSSLVISVEDTGIGIPEQSQKKIFNAFQQQELQDTHKYGGTGLGLSISAKLTSLMNGKILLESTSGEGSKFTVILNDVKIGLEEPIEEEIAKEDEEIIEFGPAKILIVDDVETNRELIKGYFDGFKFNILEAENGLEAILMTENEIPDVILMDIRMPIMNGYEATQKIKENKISSHIPIIVLTASYLESDNDASFMKLISGYLIKPVNKVNLMRELKKFLKYSITQNEANEIVKNNKLKDETFKIDSRLLNILQIDLMMEWEGLKNRKPQVRLKSFSNNLINFGHDNKLVIIEGYGKNLLESVDLFDITSINSKLKEFPKMIKKFV